MNQVTRIALATLLCAFLTVPTAWGGAKQSAQESVPVAADAYAAGAHLAKAHPAFSVRTAAVAPAEDSVATPVAVAGSQPIVLLAQADVPAPEAQPEAAATGDSNAQNDMAEVAAIVNAVQDAYDRVTDFSADFRQIYSNATLGEERESTGHVFFLKPGKMRWDYAAPTERYLISDGSDLWVYEPEFGQYFTQSLSASQLPSALRFMMGQGRLADEFTVTIPERDDERIVLALVPNTPSSQFSMLHFVVSPSDWQVRETVVFDALGNTNRLIFESVRQNIGLPDEGFSFTPPEGATRIEGP